MIDQTTDSTDYYAGGFRKSFGGVPCTVFSRRTTDGRYIRAKDSAGYDPVFDDSKAGLSRLTNDHDAIAAAREMFAATPKRKTARKTPVERVQPVSAPLEPETAQIAPTAAPAVLAAAFEPAADDDALAARVAALEATLQRMGVAIGVGAPAAANDDAAAPRRSEAERRAIVRAWRMRCEARNRADLDRRALLIANDANHGLRELATKREAERDETGRNLIAANARANAAEEQARNARDAATAYKREGDALERHLAETRDLLEQAGRRAAIEHGKRRANAMLARQRQERVNLVADEGGRKLWSAEQRAAGADRRAARMVRAASDYRKTARRAAEDVRGARAEARAIARRLEDAQRAAPRAVTPYSAPAGDTALARAFAKAGR